MTHLRKEPKFRNRMTRFQIPNTGTAGTKKNTESQLWPIPINKHRYVCIAKRQPSVRDAQIRRRLPCNHGTDFDFRTSKIVTLRDVGRRTLN